MRMRCGCSNQSLIQNQNLTQNQNQNQNHWELAVPRPQKMSLQVPDLQALPV